MRVRVLLFARYRELAGGVGERWMELAPGARVADLLAALRATSPRLPPAPAVARNGALVDAGAALADGDEIALLPPVAGG
jgi:molybdopterin converting factor small subunit